MCYDILMIFFLRDDGRERADRKKAKVEQGEVRS